MGTREVRIQTRKIGSETEVREKKCKDLSQTAPSRVSNIRRLIKNLMEAQFDVNPKFKDEMKKKTAKELREKPLGSDKLGNNYWYQVDEEANLRIYKEDVDEETWELVARSREELVALIEQLKTGPTFVRDKDKEEKGNRVDLLCDEEEGFSFGKRFSRSAR